MTPGATVREGSPEPLGASVNAAGVNFAVWSASAVAIEVCLFDETGQVETTRHSLPGRTGPVFHGLIPGVAAGARYGLRAHGPFDPARGQRFDADKLLVDPYALELDRSFAFDAALLAQPQGVDSAAILPKAVIRAAGDLPGTPAPPPVIAWGEMVIYEASVRGFTRLHPDIPPALRGTFAGLGHPAAIAHLAALGVTCLELMPAAAWIDEPHLAALGLTNAWGYNPVALMAPDPRLAPGGWAEVRAAVDALAAAGIETLIDVVLNHSGEGDAFGPTVSLRGLDNAAYYRLEPDDPAVYVNDAGTGSILALDRAPGLRLAMDSLRAWRRLGGVHGFRFDLATVMGRRPQGFDPAAPLLAAIDQDPELRPLKLIAEPWDCGPGGYQIGRFPAAWGEWNDRYRDTVRGFWRGDPISRGELARRLAGSEDLFAGRRPSRSVNFIVAHDGFTLADLVAFRRKSNSANGEDNRDGADDNRSWNNGVEGPTADPTIIAARRADQRALLATLLLSRGAPMLSMGAETGRTQGGNNNAYAQDNATGWLDWAAPDGGLTDFTRRLLALRRDHPALRADRFLTGAPGPAALPDVEWRTDSGEALRPAEWDDLQGETLVMALAEPAGAGLDRVVVALHRGPAPVEIALPEPRDGFTWRLEADSADPARVFTVEGEALSMAARSVALLVESPAPARRPKGVSDAALAKLAAAAGIRPAWRAADGVAHVAPADTLKALLAAMGLDAPTTDTARDSLRRLSESQDRRPLPFALTGRTDEAVTVIFSGAAAPPRTWLMMEDEAGQVRRVRAAAGHGVDMAIRARDGAETRGLAVRLPPAQPGRYRLWREDDPAHDCRLTIAPPACHRPEALADGRRLWGLSAQLYSLARQGDQGIGDFTTLGDLAAATAARGGAVLGVNPFHALFPADRERASPYYPSDRRFLDPIYLDVEAARDTDIPPPTPSQPARMIDYPAVWARKSRSLEARFAERPVDPGLADFTRVGGERLRRFATFQAIAETRPGVGWREWPRALQRPDSEATSTFAAAHADRVEFHQYLQWLCDLQLADAARRGSGLSLGICRDLALGAAPDGAELWADGDLVAPGVSIGAPPDPFGPQGQVWGLPPFDPHRLRANGYRHQADLLAVNMRHAGALRIDHVMGLARQFWIPDGAEAMDGAYVDYPFGDLLNVLALESQRAACLIIGEDLGTVPEGFRETLSRAGVLSYRVLPFERAGRGFKPPTDYPREAWACVSTHDLPPLAGWWDGIDIDERQSLGLITDSVADAARTERTDDKAALDNALVAEGLVDHGAPPDGRLPANVAAALHAFVAASPAMLAVAQVEDLAGERVAVNLPGTDRERPNWRRRLATPVDSLFESPLAEGIVAALRPGREP